MSKSPVPIAAAVFVALAASAWLACGSSTFSSSDAGTQKAPADCNTNADPKDSPACVDDSIGIFVSAAGADTNAGTKAAPLRTVGVALTKADVQHDRIYVCSGTYPETVKLTGPVSIYGGYSCADWSYAGTAGGTAPKIGPSGPGYALDVESVGKACVIEDVELDAQSGQNPGDSSIAVFVSSSPGPITFRRVTVVAGDGARGGEAAATNNWGTSFPTANGGTQADHDNGAPANLCPACIDGTTSTGGAGGGKDQNGADGGPPIPENPSGHNGNGGIAPGDTSCTAPPHAGADGNNANGGASGAATPGTLVAAGWTVSLGTAGANGGIAQGGGGGQGLNTAGAFNGGGSGGCGACGGAGGAGGGSGGSAFAILIFQSGVVADSCTLTVGKGGDGQAGGIGQPGQSGGAGGAPAAGGGAGCSGATGGNGGKGAGGGGGAGGNAIAIAYVGTQPSVIGGTQIEGNAGAPGSGGKGAAANDGAVGSPGAKSDIAALP